MTTMYADYGESRVKLTWVSDHKLPPINAITSVHGFCFYSEQVLLVDLHHRGWDFPGGHIGALTKELMDKEHHLLCISRTENEENRAFAHIRDDDLPMAQYFKDSKANGNISTPEMAASTIVKLLLSDNVKSGEITHI